jgi:arabinan endo-1,5-alpha-L-arabinosidase
MEEMQDSKNAELVLTSPENTRFSFTIVVEESSNSKACTFTISGKGSGTDEIKTSHYHLQNREHNSYLNLFEKLCSDFGLRLPQNKKPLAEYSFKGTYKQLLTKNLVSEMLYGYGDPAVLRVEQGKETWYYLVTTSNDAPDSFPICRSQNLIDWQFVGFVFPKGNKPKWAADGEFISDYWAPEMHKVANEFRIYFVARDKNTFELCIGVARSKTPEGPFVADDEPILKGDKIDPHVLIENEKTAYLYWKEDNNALWPNRLIELLYDHPLLISTLFINKEDEITASFIVTLWPWIQKLALMEAFLVEQILIEVVTADFAEFKKRLVRLLETQLVSVNNKILSVIEAMRTVIYAQTLSAYGSSVVGDKKIIIENDQEWEAHLVEGVWVTKHNNKFYLFYSGNDFSTDKYGIGVAVSDNPLGVFKKIAKPILQSTEEWWAPGHPSVAIGPDGKYYLFLHAFFPGKAGYKEFRALLSVAIKLENGTVVLQ